MSDLVVLNVLQRMTVHISNAANSLELYLIDWLMTVFIKIYVKKTYQFKIHCKDYVMISLH